MNTDHAGWVRDPGVLLTVLLLKGFNEGDEFEETYTPSGSKYRFDNLAALYERYTGTDLWRDDVIDGCGFKLTGWRPRERP